MRWLIPFVAIVACGCTDPNGARTALEQAGYKQIEVGGYSPWGCGEDDDLATKFKAVGPSGVPVSGVVCSGYFFKGKTIRLD